MNLLGGSSVARFLAQHWQKRPLFVRGAFPRWRDPVTPEELAGLACERSVESRLVQAPKRGHRGWRVEHGPFDARRFGTLPQSHWSLLVQGVDEHVAAVAALLDAFDFLPRWRLDDVMVSYAEPGGGVGPHVDSYDVFLVQGRGRRRWRIAEAFDPSLVEGLDLRVLRRFVPEREWVSEPGDLLYLPPGVAHCGTALESCLTFSIGFRAPALREVALAVAHERLARIGGLALYADPDLAAAAPGAAVGAAEARRLARSLGAMFRPPDEGEWTAALGRIASERKGPPAAPRRTSPARLERALAAGARWRPHPGARLAWSRSATGTVRLHADGTTHALPASLSGFARRLCRRLEVGTDDLPRRERAAALRLLCSLHAAGTLERC